MPYITKEYYDSVYKGTPISDGGTFDRLAARATDIVDMLTNHQLLGTELSKWPELIQGQIKKATAAQVEYLLTQGESKAMGAGEYGQVSAGNFSYGGRAGKESLSREELMTSAAVLNLLSPTGLLYRGVGVYG